jgi:hypothetical protein
MKRVIIVHGWEGKPDSNWFPWLTKELKTRHIEVAAPQFPPDKRPKLSEWLAVLNAQHPDENTILVGHSLGCITILRYLEHATKPVAGIVLVAGFARSIEVDELSDFLRTPVDFSSARKHTQQSIVLASDDDPYVPLDEGLFLAEGLGTKALVKHGRKHFNEEEGITEAPEILDAVLKIKA